MSSNLLKGLSASGLGPRVVSVDHRFGLLGTERLEGIAVSAGRYFGASHMDLDLDEDENFNLLFHLPTDGIRSAALGLVASVGFSGAAGPPSSVAIGATLEVFELPTYSDPGTPLPILQVNRASTITPQSSIWLEPTLTNDGTRIFSFLLPGGFAGAVAGAYGPFQRLHCRPGTHYLIRATSLNDNVRVAANLNWIEVPRA